MHLDIIQQNLTTFNVTFFYSMEKILERYEHYSYAERTLTLTDLESQVQRIAN